MKRATYDLIVIGSGPAGEKGAAKVAYFGKKVAVRDALGSGSGPTSGDAEGVFSGLRTPLPDHSPLPESAWG